VGDILGHFYDIDGRPVECETDDRLIALDLEQLRVIPTMVAVAGGLGKVAAILGGLRGSYIDVLITDMETAQAILEQSNERIA
jgi:DNA-binding transcriptional regulator LsrR (DeoR family)